MQDTIRHVLLHPARLRIIQFLALHPESTTQTIAQALADIPKPSLYRHLRTLTGMGLLKVVQENRVRGTVERVYALVPNPPDETWGIAGGEPPSPDALRKMIPALLAGLLGDFERYFESGDADLLRDTLGVSTSTLFLTDEEFAQLNGRLAEAITEYAGNPPGEGRKQRRLTCILSPMASEPEPR